MILQDKLVLLEPVEVLNDCITGKVYKKISVLI